VLFLANSACVLHYQIGTNGAASGDNIEITQMQNGNTLQQDSKSFSGTGTMALLDFDKIIFKIQDYWN
jgi:hypothetical protein